MTSGRHDSSRAELPAGKARPPVSAILRLDLTFGFIRRKAIVITKSFLESG